MSFPTYPEYKDSGVERLGNVPALWSVEPLKRHCDVMPSNIDKKSADNEQPVLLCNYTDVYYNDVITHDLDFMKATATKAQIEKFSLREGDVLFTKDSESPDDIAVAAYVPSNLPNIVCGYHLSVARVHRTLNGKFLKRYFDSHTARAYFHVSANGLTRVGLSQYASDNLPIPTPPLQEQVMITAFLDHETARIDALVEEQQRLIELLKEKRQAVISHAVTKGLDPDVPMKGSGVEWLGKLPAHWDVVALKRIVEFQRGHDLPVETREQGEVPVVSSGGYSGFHNKAMAEAPGIVTGRYGSIGKFFLLEEEYWPLNTSLYSIRMNGNRPRYIWYLLHSLSEHFVLNSLKSAVPGVDRNDIHVVMSARAPIAEQDQIAAYLDKVSEQIDLLTVEAKGNIKLLNERRSALISAAVTGKIDVRGWQPPAVQVAAAETTTTEGL